jgi:TonB family protein
MFRIESFIESSGLDHKRGMQILINKVVTLGLIILTFAAVAFAEGGRKVLVIAPSPYPVMARELRVSGTVKMQAVVATSGRVKEIRVVDGSPLLANAALESAKKWQFQPAPSETVEVIAINFKK